MQTCYPTRFQAVSGMSFPKRRMGSVSPSTTPNAGRDLAAAAFAPAIGSDDVEPDDQGAIDVDNRFERCDHVRKAVFLFFRRRQRCG